MKIKIIQDTKDDGNLIVIREKTDPKYYGVANGAGESRLLHAVAKQLNKDGWDFIKKRMYKDGHMVDDWQQYLRERKPVNGRQLAIYNSEWQLRGAEEDFNNGQCVLTIFNLAKTS
jgi:hypothetical protein